MFDYAPSGSWKSPVTSEMIASKAVRFSGIQVGDGKIYFSEQRPYEKGRTTIFSYTLDKSSKELLSQSYNARTRVHEYGGVSFFLQDSLLFFINDKDQNIYQIKDDSIIQITSNDFRYADLFYDANTHFLYAIREDHADEKNVINTIVKIEIPSKKETIVAEGHDFYANPAISPDGKFLSYLSWNHPNMPWDTTMLCLQSVDTGEVKVIAGDGQVSIFQPKWSKDGYLYFISDSTGWWNLYRYKQGKTDAIWEKEAEFGMPQWIFGYSTYDFIDEDRLVCSFLEKGKQHLGIYTISKKEFFELNTPYTSYNFIQVQGDILAFIGASPTKPSSVIAYDLQSSSLHVIKKAQENEIEEGYISKGKFLSFPSNGKTSYAFFYPPKNKDFQKLADELPPLIVKCHGGPTDYSGNSLSYQIQYWTSRGFAFVDVNYGGSTGFGRAYRERLKGNWGVEDVNDCVNVVKYLSEQKLIDPKRVAIRGGSAGGYTTLACLTFTDVFTAGASYYGVSDLELLAKDTHKFEARYLDSIVGPYPQEKQKYFERSPINFVERLSCPVILLQGDEDKVVPPNQSEAMFEALKKKNIPTAYVLFEGEQHGFRKSENIKRAIEAEYYFYAKIFHFPLSENIAPIKIENLQGEK